MALYYWIPTFAGMTGWWKSDGLFDCQVNNYGIEGLIHKIVNKNNNILNLM